MIKGQSRNGEGGDHWGADMYKIKSNREENTILIPATLDMHFPLLRFMFWTKGYRCVPLEDDDEFLVREEGLKYVNYDICYPFVLMTGQVVSALRSGKYDPKKTFILMPTAGDACRGACYIGLMQRSLRNSHFEDVRVMTINVRHVCDEISFPITLDTAGCSDCSTATFCCCARTRRARTR